MDTESLLRLVDDLRARPSEEEWFEFKRRKVQPDEKLGEYVSALANAAAYQGRSLAYLVLGVDNDTHQVVGTDFNFRTAKHKRQDLMLWTLTQLEPRVHVDPHEVLHPDGRLVVFTIGAAVGQPVRFRGGGWIRVGEHKTQLANHPAIERAIWHMNSDWSAEIVPNASLADLDPDAIGRARTEYVEKHPAQASDVLNWDDATFLDKAKVTRRGQITRASMVLLGRPEAVHLLSPAVARMTWLLKGESGQDLDYAHIDPPFILGVDDVARRIRNLTLRTLPSGSLFPTEIQQYDNYVLREALHNAIAHQDYSLQGRVQVVEYPEHLLITNVGSFLPGSVDRVIEQDAPQEIYRNPFLAACMVTLNMIDTQGGGIRRMFARQMERFLPLPDYDLSDPHRVAVTIPGKVLDEQFTRLLMEREDLDLASALLLDRVQKGQSIPHEAHKQLKKRGLVEGRYPNTVVSGRVAKVTGGVARHVRRSGLDNRFYRELVVKLIREHEPVTRSQVNDLLMEKLPESLSPAQKQTKVSNLLRALSQEGMIENRGSRRYPQWFSTKRN